MLVHLQQPRVFLQKFLLVSNYVVSFNTEAEGEALFHLLLAECLTDIPKVFISLSILVVPEVYGSSLLILANIGEQPC